MIDLDIRRSANMLHKRYRGEAVFIASKRADALLNQGDHEGCSVWIRIANATMYLERKRIGKGESLH